MKKLLALLLSIAMVLSLAACADEPEVTTAFPDVRPRDYYHKAVLWAAQRGITVGMDGGYFRPALNCTRAQIVTFLYRDVKNP